jgi:hypothetical protein
MKCNFILLSIFSLLLNFFVHAQTDLDCNFGLLEDTSTQTFYLIAKSDTALWQLSKEVFSTMFDETITWHFVCVDSVLYIVSYFEVEPSFQSVEILQRFERISYAKNHLDFNFRVFFVLRNEQYKNIRILQNELVLHNNLGITKIPLEDVTVEILEEFFRE